MHRSFLSYNVARYFICICLAIRKMTATMMMISAIIIMFNFKKRIQSVSDHRRFSVHAAACLCVMNDDDEATCSRTAKQSILLWSFLICSSQVEVTFLHTDVQCSGECERKERISNQIIDHLHVSAERWWY